MAGCTAFFEETIGIDIGWSFDTVIGDGDMANCAFVRGVGDGENPLNPSLPIYFDTMLWVKCHTRAKTTAWVAATAIFDPPLGRRRRIPGVST